MCNFICSSHAPRNVDLGHVSLLVLDGIVNNVTPAKVMLDSGASGLFVDKEFLQKFGIPFFPKSHSLSVEGFDGKGSQPITHDVTLTLDLNGHLEKTLFNVVTLKRYDIILGKPWLNHHNPTISWPTDTLVFDSPSCKLHRKESPELLKELSPITISSDEFMRIVEDEQLEVYAIAVEDLKAYLDKLESQEPYSPEQEMKTLQKAIPSKYHDLLPLFSKASADQLPPHRYIDHEINLQPGSKPSFGPLYNMSDLELKALDYYLKENLDKGYIRPSTSSAASPVLFVKKADGSLRFCVDYRALNKITEKNKYPLPPINESLRILAKGKIFTKLDLRSAYNLIRIKEGDEWKTAFRTRYGLYEYLVMPFGLTNAPATCQQFVNDVLREYLDRFVVVYLDDILIFSEDPAEHDSHVRKVLQKLAAANLFVKGEKCEFDTTSTTFLGFVVTPNGIEMDPKKVSTVKEWPTPKNLKDVRSFLGFASFYRRFIKGFSAIAKPLSLLTKKDQPFRWTDSQEKAFTILKDKFCTGPILKHFDPTKETVLETDASDQVISGVLSQWFPSEGQTMLHPIAYMSKKMSPAECNYTVGDKELLAIIEAVREYQHMLLSLEKPVQIITDHANLVNISTKSIRNRRHARWALELSEIPFTLVHRPGLNNHRADALTRRSADMDPVSQTLPLNQPIIQPSKVLLNNMQLQAMIYSLQPAMLKDFQAPLQADKWAQSVIKAIKDKDKKHPDLDLALCEVDSDGQLQYKGLYYVPNDKDLRLKILKDYHDHPSAGHGGQAATFELINRNFWWPKMRQDIAQYIRNCDTCQRIKPVRHSPYGLLKPLEIPVNRWTSLSMDLITGLPSSGQDNNDAILVVVDRLTKMSHFIPCHTTLDSQTLSSLLRDYVFKYHGVPQDIVSDRGSIFTSELTKSFAKVLGIQQKFSTAFHPQSDGQTERINAILEQYLRGYCNYQQDNWTDLLTFAEFSYNNTQSSTLKTTPFFANYGFHPRSMVLELFPEVTQDTPDAVKDYATYLKDLEGYLKQEMLWAQDAMEEQANKHLSPPPVYQPGDKVWLLRKYIHTTRPSNKLDFKKLGPFPIVSKVSTHAYKLLLPSSMKVHPVFHVSLLEPYATDPLPGQVKPPAPPVIVDEQEEWFVEEVYDVSPKGPLRYLVKWVGYHDPTWEPYENVKDCEALDKFYERYPNKRRPIR